MKKMISYRIYLHRDNVISYIAKQLWDYIREAEAYAVSGWAINDDIEVELPNGETAWLTVDIDGQGEMVEDISGITFFETKKIDISYAKITYYDENGNIETVANITKKLQKHFQ